jgi:basic amino acid/polyamine antiporter, APA family
VTMGEFIAWIIGWALVLEYALASATVSIAWSEYLNSLVLTLTGSAIPYQWSHSPWETSLTGVGGIVNLPAILILFLLTLLLIKGTQESATVNSIIVVVKVSIVLLFIALGWGFINDVNYTPFTIPDQVGHELWNRHGWGGVVGGASIVFFAFIGFDAVSTAAQEAKNPKRDMPIGILGSLVICTVLFVLFSHVLTGIANWEEFKVAGKEASVAYAINKYMPGYEWLATLITVAILAGFSSVILVMLMGQSRVFYSMSKDGLVPPVFSQLHPTFRTPHKANWILFVFVSLFGGFVPGNVAGDLTSFGTLFAFVLVCAGIWVMRVKNPEAVRPFKTPFVPLIPILGILVCSGLIYSLDYKTQLMAFGWLLFGLVIYFLYSKKNSVLRKG